MGNRVQDKQPTIHSLEKLHNKEVPKTDAWISFGTGSRKDLMGKLGVGWKVGN